MSSEHLQSQMSGQEAEQDWQAALAQLYQDHLKPTQHLQQELLQAAQAVAAATCELLLQAENAAGPAAEEVKEKVTVKRIWQQVCGDICARAFTSCATPCSCWTSMDPSCVVPVAGIASGQHVPETGTALMQLIYVISSPVKLPCDLICSCLCCPVICSWRPSMGSG